MTMRQVVAQMIYILIGLSKTSTKLLHIIQHINDIIKNSAILQGVNVRVSKSATIMLNSGNRVLDQTSRSLTGLRSR